MNPFIDAIDRMFEELVHDAWRAPRRGRQPRPEAGTALELQLPIAGARCGDVAFATEGQRLTITVRHGATDSVNGLGRAIVREAQEHFQQSVTLPVGTEPAAIEVRFDPDALRIRVHLRIRSRDEEKT